MNFAGIGGMVEEKKPLLTHGHRCYTVASLAAKTTRIMVECRQSLQRRCWTSVCSRLMAVLRSPAVRLFCYTIFNLLHNNLSNKHSQNMHFDFKYSFKSFQIKFSLKITANQTQNTAPINIKKNKKKRLNFYKMSDSL